MTAHQLRSRNWFGRNDLDGFVHRSWLEAEGFSDAVFDGRPVGMPLARKGGTVILFGNLCPDGAVLKQSAASPHLLTHRGRAVVFEDHADLHRRIDDESVPIDENSVLVLEQVGPRGAPGMPEWGAAPIPARLLRRGVKDMVRISDARMSGSSYGTVVLHVAPESAVGGPLALVRDGDEIELDIPGRRLTLKVGDDELARRRAAWKPRPAHFSRGYGKLFLDPVLQANEGCDFDYPRGRTPVRHEDRRPVPQLARGIGPSRAESKGRKVTER
jgi:dihydroxy-acid dehydratase